MIEKLMPRNKIGIDKMNLFNLPVTHIDFDVLLAHPREKVKIFYNQNEYYLETPDGTKISYLKIKDNQIFNEFIVWVDARRREHQMLSFSATNLYTMNLSNLSTEEVKNHLVNIRFYLLSKYGITLDINKVQIKLLELNCTFSLLGNFSEYHRVLKLLMHLVPLAHSNLQLYLGENKKDYILNLETILKKNKSMEIIIYDKSAQLYNKKGIKTGTNLMRIEIRLLTSRKITEAFENNQLKHLTDEAIARYFMRQFSQKFNLIYERWMKKNQRELRRLITECKKNAPIHWQTNFLESCRNCEQCNNLPLLLDIDHLFLLIRAEKDKNRNTSRTIKEFRNKMKRRENDCFSKKDAKKVEEIFRAVKNAYEETVDIISTDADANHR